MIMNSMPMKAAANNIVILIFGVCVRLLGLRVAG